MIAAAMALSSCKDSKPADVEVYKSDESVQCDNSSGIPREQMQQELVDAGIDVLCAMKASDRLVHPALCGAPTGIVNLYRIRGSNQDDAEALGFIPTSNLGLPDNTCSSS